MKKRIIILLLVLFFVGIAIIIGKNILLKSYSLEYDDFYVGDDTQELRVLVIEINPVLNSIEGHPKVSEWLGFNTQVSVNELIDDLEYSSHNYLDVNVVGWDYLNEFPTYKNPGTMSDGNILTEEFTYNGTEHYRIKEDMYIYYANKGNSSYWWNLYRNGVLGGDSVLNSTLEYSFDYTYLLDRLDLINRRNNNEFDQVWLVGIDPMFNYETIMIGRNPYWTNSPGYVADCDNFVIGGSSMSRRDAQLHALGHGMESIMQAAFSRSYQLYDDYTGESSYKYYYGAYNSYAENSITVPNGNNYIEYLGLNDWERFVLNDYANASEDGVTGVGNIHFPFNATSDYDYNNPRNIRSNWYQWKTYDPATGASTYFDLDNSDVWIYHEPGLTNMSGQSGILYPEDFSDRLYSRWWFYLMPYFSGYSIYGYYNNWWKYFVSLDFVDNMYELDSTDIVVKKGEYVPVNLKLTYNSQKEYMLDKIVRGDNVEFQYPNVLGFKDGYVYAKNAGTTRMRVAYDGKYIIYDVVVVDEFYPVESIEFDKSFIAIKNRKFVQLNYTISPSNASNQNVIFTSSNDAAIGVYSGGLLYSWKPGRATITARTADGGFIDTIDVLVIVNPNEMASFMYDTVDVGLGRKRQLDYINNSSVVSDVQFISSDESVASVDNDGRVTGMKKGVAEISLLSNDGQVQSKVKVLVGNVNVLNSSKYDISLEKGLITLPSKIDSNTFNSNITSDFNVDYVSSTYMGTGKEITVSMNDDIIKTYQVLVYGDVNGDGELSLSDIMKIAKYIYKDDSILNNMYLEAADYNHDGKCQLTDIMKIAEKVYISHELPIPIVEKDIFN